MTNPDTPTPDEQADMAGTSMDDLPDADGMDQDVDADEDGDDADALEDAQEDAAEHREEEGGYQ